MISHGIILDSREIFDRIKLRKFKNPGAWGIIDSLVQRITSRDFSQDWFLTSAQRVLNPKEDFQDGFSVENVRTSASFKMFFREYALGNEKSSRTEGL